MGSVVAVVMVALLVAYVTVVIRGRKGSVVSKRGMGVGADLGGLADAPRMRVRDVRLTGPDQAEIVLEPLDPDTEGASPMRFPVWLQRDEFGYQVLTQWRHEDEPVALVLPPGGRLIRLRSTESLQHLTLRRLAED